MVVYSVPPYEFLLSTGSVFLHSAMKLQLRFQHGICIVHVSQFPSFWRNTAQTVYTCTEVVRTLCCHHDIQPVLILCLHACCIHDCSMPSFTPILSFSGVDVDEDLESGFAESMDQQGTACIDSVHACTCTCRSSYIIESS